MLKNIDIVLVLMGIVMLIMDGLEATHQIRTKLQNRSIPILILSARSLKQDIQKSLEVGANEHIVKPVSITQLISRLDDWKQLLASHKSQV